MTSSFLWCAWKTKRSCIWVNTVNAPFQRSIISSPLASKIRAFGWMYLKTTSWHRHVVSAAGTFFFTSAHKVKASVQVLAMPAEWKKYHLREQWNSQSIHSALNQLQLRAPLYLAITCPPCGHRREGRQQSGTPPSCLDLVLPEDALPQAFSVALSLLRVVSGRQCPSEKKAKNPWQQGNI